jgi:hypothetical protein
MDKDIDPFDPKAVQHESKFMQELAALVRKHHDSMDVSLMAGDLERTLAALDENLLEIEWPRIIPEPRSESEVFISPPPPPLSQKPLKLDDSRPVTAALEDRDHRIAQLEATVKELYAKLNK